MAKGTAGRSAHASPSTRTDYRKVPAERSLARAVPKRRRAENNNVTQSATECCPQIRELLVTNCLFIGAPTQPRRRTGGGAIPKEDGEELWIKADDCCQFGGGIDRPNCLRLGSLIRGLSFCAFEQRMKGPQENVL